MSHLQDLQRAISAVWGSNLGQSSQRDKVLCVWQEPLQLPQAASILLPVPHQALHQGAQLVSPLHHPLLVCPELGQLQGEVIPAESKIEKSEITTFAKCMAYTLWLFPSFVISLEILSKAVGKCNILLPRTQTVILYNRSLILFHTLAAYTMSDHVWRNVCCFFKKLTQAYHS